MLKKHFEIIKGHLPQLVQDTNVDELVPKLISNNVFTQEMVDRILASADESAKSQAISLYLNIHKRGPQAFAKLISALMESDHVILAKTLYNADIDSPTSSSAVYEDHPDSLASHTVPFKFPWYMDKEIINGINEGNHLPGDMINLCEQNDVKVKVRNADRLRETTDELPQCYKMSSNPRGYALIINNILFQDQNYLRRNGAENDERAMKQLLEQLYFVVEPHTNKTRDEMREIVCRFSERTDWRSVDCACVVLMSHGDEGDSEEDTQIMGIDGLGFKTRDVISYFYNDSCPLLIKKPKIFIFQSCRGKLPDRGVEYDLYSLPFAINSRTETDGRAVHRTVRDRRQSDMFVAHPVPPGIKANRDKYSGAWFIQTIVRVFAEHAWREDLENLFKIVDHQIKNMTNLYEPNYQTVTTNTIGWNKKLYFNPGLHRNVDGDIVRADTDTPTSAQGMDVVDTPSECQSYHKKEDKLRLTPKKNANSSSCCLSCQPS